MNWDERCDCGSGNKYKHCCGKRRWRKYLEEHPELRKKSKKT